MTTNSSRETQDFAEGRPREDHRQEQPLYDAKGVSIVRLDNNPASETGYLMRIKMSVEGQDTAEAQDAARTQDETSSTNNTTSSASTSPDKKTLPNKEKPHVLIVEDTVELAEVIQATVEGMGLSAEHATHGKIALERLKNVSPSLILLDIGLPDITGWEMLKSIKEMYNSSSSMPVIIVITAYGDPANRLIGKLQDINSYLIKPFTPDQIERTIRETLSLG